MACQKEYSLVSLCLLTTKLMKRAYKIEDCNEIQGDLDKLHSWSVKWQMEFKASKCHAMKMGNSKNIPCKTYKWEKKLK